ncbi:hypothetical protein [Algoriphagus algorifonticola]|uniref:hypothetical protein n=1 Tax=Algoriphagus algorifonticola TaxID=2593007 RepID=UPI0011AB1A03|nr:hypothetical protein [Algoriphagus algorifonticola]
MLSYKNTSYWLLIPFFITLFGFSRYWLGFTSAPLDWHLHGLSALSWYLILIIQPYLISKKSFQTHRKLGFVGIFIAGTVFISAVSVISGNMDINQGPRVAVKYSTSFAELITMLGFAFSVLAAVFSVKKPDVHAAWMISTVFWVMPPATTRLMFLVLIGIYQSPENLPLSPFILNGINIGVLLGIIILLIVRYKKKKLAFSIPYVVVGIFTLLRLLIIFGLKDSKWVESFIKGIFEN